MGQKIRAEEPTVVVFRDEAQLIARDRAELPADSSGRSSGAAVMESTRGAARRYLGNPVLETAQAEIDVFQIRAEALIETIQLFEHGGGERDRR